MKRIAYIGLLITAAVGGASGAEISGAARAGVSWWSSLDHPGLNRAIEQGLDANPDPVAAMARIRAAEADVRAAGASRLPSASGRVGYRWGREKSMDTGGIEDEIDPLVASGSLAWELDVFGRVGADVASAEARTGMRVADAAAIRLALALDIARTYIELARHNEEVSWLTVRLEAAAALHQQSRRRTESGLEAPTVADEMHAIQQQAAHRLMQAEIDRDQIMARLRNLLGGHPPEILPEGLSAFTLPAPPDLSQTNLHLLRPDVVRAHQKLLAATGDREAARRQRLPTLSLVVSAAGEGQDTGGMENWSAWAGPVVSIPLWEPELGARSRAASARSEAAEAEWISVSLRAIQEIDTAWVQRRNARDMIEHMEERYNALRRIAASAGRKREAGLIRDAEHQRAIIDMTAAVIDRIQWQAAGLRAHIDLLAALGGRAAAP